MDLGKPSNAGDSAQVVIDPRLSYRPLSPAGASDDGDGGRYTVADDGAGERGGGSGDPDGSRAIACANSPAVICL